MGKPTVRGRTSTGSHQRTNPSPRHKNRTRIQELSVNQDASFSATFAPLRELSRPVLDLLQTREAESRRREIRGSLQTHAPHQTRQGDPSSTLIRLIICRRRPMLRRLN
jgi:endonuclease/exonuclease/phosphatase (EEP) superfamily protein YafD